MFLSWYRRLVNPKNRPGRPARPRFRPQLLALEERVVPTTFTEVEPNNTAATANAVTIPVSDILASPADSWLNISGTTSTGTDVDYFRFTLTARSGVFLDLDSREVGLSNTLNGFLTVYNSAGTTVLASNDNGYDFLTGWPAPFALTGVSTADSAVYLELTPNTYLVRVSSQSSTTGNYVLRLLADSTFSSTVPALNSNPGAPATVFLDFDGHSSTSDAWVTRPGSPGPYAIPAFDVNGNGAEWSPEERLIISNVWRLVAEDMAPFRVNVSTNYTGLFTDRVGFRQVIGNSNGSHIGEPTTTLGTAFINSFGLGGSNNNVAFTLASNFTNLYGGGISGRISGRALEMANVSSHEVGHAFGLQHYVSAGQQNALMFTPSQGIRRMTWFQGTSVAGPQNDLATITNTTNGFGYRVDDYGGTIAAAFVLSPSGDTYGVSGTIAQLTDLDFFRFTASGPTTIYGYQDSYTGNLDVRLRLFDAAGMLLATADDPATFDAILTPDLPAGTYYVEVASNGGPGEVGTYNLFISTAVPIPDIQVLDGPSDVGNEVGVVSFGTTPAGVPVDRTLTVQNVGTATLTLDPAITVTGGFTLLAGFGSTTLEPGQQTTFTVRLPATATGTFTGQVSFGTNDPDENPFNFTVTGTVGTPPPVVILDDGDPSFSATPGFIPFTGQGYQNDVTFAAAGFGVESATWSLSGLPAGVYRVSATWSIDANRATNAPFAVFDGTLLAVVPVNQELAPADFTDAGVGWKDLGTFAINSGTLTVRLTDQANEFVIADAVRLERLASSPAVQLANGPVLVPAGGTSGYGITPVGTAVTRTFTVTNRGSANLTLGSITAPAGFTVATPFGTTTLGPGASTTFALRLNATAAGSYAGPVSFSTNVTGLNPFTFTVNGTVGTAPVIILDDGDPGFSATAGFIPFSGQGHQHDVTYAAAGTGSHTATWTFTGLTAGLYRVSTTWSVDANRAVNAPYTIFDGTTSGTNLGTVLVNQEQVPSHFVSGGTSWYNLGGPYTISSSTLTVRLSDLANDFVIADAIRIERLASNPVTILDDGDAGFSATPGFTAFTGQGFQNDVRFAAAGSGSESATWTFTVTPGVYRVSVTWSPDPNRATNAPFTVLNGATPLGTFLVNQEQAPAGFSANGAVWQDLGGGSFTVTGTQLVVRLTNAANEFVIADAIRIERLA